MIIELTDSELSSLMWEGGEGFCTTCGSQQSGVEPDAEGYKCENCEELSVSGVEQLLLLCQIRIVADNRFLEDEEPRVTK